MARGGSPLTKRLEIVPVRCHALAGRGQQRFGACAGSAITTVTGTNPSPGSTGRTPKIVWGKPRTASPRAHGAVQTLAATSKCSIRKRATAETLTLLGYAQRPPITQCGELVLRPGSGATLPRHRRAFITCRGAPCPCEGLRHGLLQPHGGQISQ